MHGKPPILSWSMVMRSNATVVTSNDQLSPGRFGRALLASAGAYGRLDRQAYGHDVIGPGMAAWDRLPWQLLWISPINCGAPVSLVTRGVMKEA
jgi:hypothetical protein